MTEQHICSTVTSWKRLDRLIEAGHLKAEKPFPNSQIYHITINQENKAIVIMQEVTEYRRHLTRLLKYLDSLYRREQPANQKKQIGLALLELSRLNECISHLLYYYAVNTWPEFINDKIALGNVYGRVFLELSQIKQFIANTFADDLSIFDEIANTHNRDIRKVFREYDILNSKIAALLEQSRLGDYLDNVFASTEEITRQRVTELS